MLLADPHALWLIALLLVVFTRDFLAPFLPLFVIFQVMVWMTSPANQTPPLVMFDFVVRRVSYVVYGALSGLALVAAMNTRELIPVHTISHKKLHLAGPLSMVCVAYGTYALATTTGLTKQFEEFGDRDADDPLEIALFASLFVILLVLFASILVLSWLGFKTVITYRYRDGGLSVRHHPPSRIIVELVLALTLLVAPHAFWIYMTLPPVSWPQGASAAVTIVLEFLLWIAVWYVFNARHKMSKYYFARRYSHITWNGFVLTVGGVHIGSAIAYAVAAELLTTAFQTEMLLLGFSVAVVFVAAVVWAWPQSTFRDDSRYAEVEDSSSSSSSDDAPARPAPTNRQIEERERELGMFDN